MFLALITGLSPALPNAFAENSSGEGTPSTQPELTLFDASFNSDTVMYRFGYTFPTGPSYDYFDAVLDARIEFITDAGSAPAVYFRNDPNVNAVRITGDSSIYLNLTLPRSFFDEQLKAMKLDQGRLVFTLHVLTPDGNDIPSKEQTYTGLVDPKPLPGSGVASKTNQTDSKPAGQAAAKPAGSASISPAPSATRYPKVISISAFGFNHLALKNDGSVWEWGNTKGAEQVSGLPSNIVKVAAGTRHRLALDSDGNVWAWGMNDFGQLGNDINGYANFYTAPVKAQIEHVKDILAFDNTSYALKEDGTVWIWGDEVFVSNSIMESTKPLEYPIQIPGINHVTSIAGGYKMLMLKDDGTVWYYQGKGSGKVFTGPHQMKYVISPIFEILGIRFATVDPIPEFTKVVKIWGGGNPRYALKQDGTLWMWGESQPVLKKTADIVKLSSGYYHTLLLKKDGTVWTSGTNRQGELGLGYADNSEDYHTFHRVTVIKDAVDIAGGLMNSYVLKKDGTVWAWGYNDKRGVLGDGSTNKRLVPVRIPGLNPPHGYDMEGHWAQAAMERLYDQSILGGYSDYSVKPNAAITREQFVKMLVQAKGLAAVKGKTSFSDVPAKRWSNGAIEAAVANGIIQPNEYGQHFLPEGNITRFEIAAMAARALGLQPNESALAFQDNADIKNQRGNIGAAVEAGIIGGFQDGTFRPNQTATRAEAAVIITRIMDYAK
ncbi:S-layer homology domain-containing protein [Paenibacillus tianjinensis]|uniref:S-layer homology domain-containing protein n=1 Tax=Paenibacillus tianjinensis TaxID=2810347 RepID=A0ABX7LCR1_9BACL|nr:S-layer homology domain-containing protein [Paenibacillus tianjinensis]QSF45046.1 S-layer homology domain-containing protein [Paenibacillus tianjinensis]